MISSNINQQLELVLKNWSSLSLPGQPALVKKFTKGLNHQCYLIRSADKFFVLKLFSSANKAAAFSQQLAFDHGIAPMVYSVFQNYSAIVMEYIPSGRLTANSTTSQELGVIAKSLQRLHSIPKKLISKFVGEFSLLSNCENYLNLIGNNEKSVHLIHQKLMPALQHFNDDSTQTCLCHDDLVIENCFILQNKALLIDWEYAQINNPWFDIAGIIIYFNLNHQQASVFIQQYQTKWLPLISSPIYYSSQISLLWIDILWHLSNDSLLNESELSNKLTKLKYLAEKMDISI